MGNLQIKNVPDDLHEQVRQHAASQHLSIRDYVLRLIERDVGRASADWEEIARKVRRVKLPRPASAYVREARDERERDLDAALWGEAAAAEEGGAYRDRP